MKQILVAITLTFLLSGCRGYVINDKDLVVKEIKAGGDGYKYNYRCWNGGSFFSIQSNEFFQLGDTMKIRNLMP